MKAEAYHYKCVFRAVKFKLALIFSCSLSLACAQTNGTSYICYLDDAPSQKETIQEQFVAPADTHPFNKYLIDIKRVLKQRHAPYQVMLEMKVQNSYSGIIQASDHERRRIIAINEKFYSSRVAQKYQKALFIWIMGHEIAHHINIDGPRGGSNTIQNKSRELLADENGGYVLGKLTSDIALNDLDSFMLRALSDREHSSVYPRLIYRIMATKAGWLRAKAENLDYNQGKTVLNTIVVKEKIENNDSSAVNVTALDTLSTILLRRFETEGEIYFGFGDKGISIGYINKSVCCINYGSDKLHAVFKDDRSKKVYRKGKYIGLIYYNKEYGSSPTVIQDKSLVTKHFKKYDQMYSAKDQKRISDSVNAEVVKEIIKALNVLK